MSIHTKVSHIVKRPEFEDHQIEEVFNGLHLLILKFLLPNTFLKIFFILFILQSKGRANSELGRHTGKIS